MMVGKGLIAAIIMLVIAMFVFGAIGTDAIISSSNGSDALTAGGVPASTIALYSIIGLIFVVAIIMLVLKVGTG